MDWSIGCACHGKALVDPEMGTLKGLVARFNAMETPGEQSTDSRLDSPEQVGNFLKDEATLPSRSILKKKGVGIARRVIFFVPASGEGCVNRRKIRKTRTIEGSSQYHQITGKGDPGVVFMRKRPCHKCNCCRTLRDPTRQDCDQNERCGKIEQIELEEEDVTEACITRSQISTRGQKISEAVKIHDVIAVELTHENEQFMLGIVLPVPDGKQPVHAENANPIFFWGEHGDSYMGDMQSDDQVLLVRKFETEKPGLNTFALTTKVFPVFIEDVRWNLTVRNKKDKQLGDLNEIEGPRRSVRTSSAGTTPEAEVLGHIKTTSRYRLSSDCKASLLFHCCSADVIEDEDE